jgi:glyoxylase-like metal-dependent hydrolase (beta-lactamase superfamily II)
MNASTRFHAGTAAGNASARVGDRTARGAAAAGLRTALRIAPIAAALSAALLAGCVGDGASRPAVESQVPAVASTQVVHLQNGFTEVYLANNGAGRWLMIDTGLPDLSKQGIPGSGGDALVSEMARNGIKPSDVSLVVVTHGHGDHAGNASYFQKTHGIRIAAGVADADKFHRGKTDLTKTDRAAWGSTGATLAAISDLDYPPFDPNVVVGVDPVDLAPYGFRGEVYPAPGHTPGSVVVALEGHLFSGDLIGVDVDVSGNSLETLKIVPNGKGAAEFFFVENRAQAKAQLSLVERLLAKYRVHTVYPTHFGPLRADQVQRYIEANRIASK